MSENSNFRSMLEFVMTWSRILCTKISIYYDFSEVSFKCASLQINIIFNMLISQLKITSWMTQSTPFIR